jgi:hypothetical protein
MKTNILLLALVFGCMIPTYSQLNLHRKLDAAPEQLQNKKNSDFDKYNFVDKFGAPLSNPAEMSPMIPGQNKFSDKIQSRNAMPCFHPKSGDKMPCLNPSGNFPMRVFKPKDVTWGILW